MTSSASAAAAATPVGSVKSDDRKPALIVDYDVDDPSENFVDALPDLSRYTYVWILTKRSGRPVGLVEASASVTDVREKLRTLTPTTADGDSPASSGGHHAGPAPTVTVVICTRDRADDLVRALESLERQTYRDFRVLVVDNAPSGQTTARAVEGLRGRFDHLDYVVEPEPGLSNARNCAIQTVGTDVVAWIDDDEVADENWLAEIVAAFIRYPDAAAVSGTVVPAELETWPQWWFEQYGGHSKGRGFTKAVFPQGDTGKQSPLYPLPAFGAGANMAIRTSAMTGLGGFDRALGAGSPTFGGEDTLLFSQLLVGGQTVVYEPAALTRHFHRRTYAELQRQMFGYGVGLTAYYAALLRWRWWLLMPLILLAPRAILDLLGSGGSAIKSGLPEDFPQELLRLKRRGMLSGPTAYLRARRRTSRRRPAERA